MAAAKYPLGAPGSLNRTRRVFLSGSLAMAACGAAVPAPAVADILARLFQTAPAKPEWFAPAFLARIPIGQVNAVLDSVRAHFGSFVRTTPDGDYYTVHLTKGDVRVLLRLNGDGLINTLRVRPASAG